LPYSFSNFLTKETMWKSFIAGVIVGLLLITTPPCSSAVNRWIESWWIPAQFLRSFALVQGSHESIIVSESCQLGIFDQIEALSSCGIFSCECHATLSQLGQDLDVSYLVLESLLDSLGEMRLVSLGNAGSYCLSGTSKRFLVGDNSVCGMAIASNHKEVLWRLASLSSVARQRAEESVSSFLRPKEIIDQHDGEKQLWSMFARTTAVFSRNLAFKVATTVKAFARTVEQPLVFDVGCGSGEYLRAVMNTLGANAKGVYVDLPEVLKETKLLHDSAVTSHEQVFQFYAASILDDSLAKLLTIPRAPKIVMINSVLQHLSDDQIGTSILQITNAMQQGCDSAVCGFIVVTELFKRDSSAWEPPEIIPLTAVFDVVLRAITRHGCVRTAAKLLSAIQRTGLTLVSQTTLFPMPGVVLLFTVQPSAVLS
jgi:hypothetical protein